MTVDNMHGILRSNLRARAEAKLLQAEVNTTSSESTQVLHNLRVHQIELELQNEELRQSQVALDIAHTRYFDLYELAPVGYCTISQSGHIEQANLTLSSLLGVHRDSLIKQPITKFICKDDQDSYYFHKKGLLEIGHRQTCEIRMMKGDGTKFWVYLESIVVNGEDCSPVFRIALNDISERKLLEKEVSIAAIAFESQEAMMITDANRVIMRVNNAFIKSTGYSAEDVVGQMSKLLQSGYHDSDFYKSMWDAINLTGKWQGEIWAKRKNGETYPKYLTISAVKDNNGVITNYIGVHHDITERKLAEDKINELAFFDPLTRLPNRRLFLDRLNQALASSARGKQKGALLFLDLDHFKTLNDTLGHDVGDSLLKQVAQRLSACVREGDTVARLGGDEFVVLLEDLGEQALEAAARTETIAEKVLHTLNQPYQLGKHNYHGTPSIGATLFDDHQFGIDELLKQADIAMYEAKNAGRNRLRFFDPKMQDAIASRASLELALQKAIEQQQFQLHYQIQVNSTGHALGAEALIRWQHPVRGMISPAHFIPLAEDSGLILPIGQWVLETACAQLKLWSQNDLTRHLTLSVNVSTKQFFQSGFIEQVQAAVKYHGIIPTQLKLELTESMLVDDIESIIVTMNALSEIGVKFSLDDFGTGYSSLQYLKKLPLYQLKIDQSFVRDIVSDKHDRAIVRTIIAMAHSLDLSVISEGVETEEQRQFLINKGCLNFQGYLFSKPVPIEAFEALLSKNRLILKVG